MQFYIVSGGKAGKNYKHLTASTEILKKEGGSSWQPVASLPTSRYDLRGVSLPNGHFMVSGLLHIVQVMTLHYASIQVETRYTKGIYQKAWKTCWTMIPMRTSGLWWARWPMPAISTAWASCQRRLLTTVSDKFSMWFYLFTKTQMIFKIKDFTRRRKIWWCLWRCFPFNCMTNMFSRPAYVFVRLKRRADGGKLKTSRCGTCSWQLNIFARWWNIFLRSCASKIFFAPHWSGSTGSWNKWSGE